MPKFAEIEIEKIILSAQNVRKIDADLGIDELAQSIEEQGLLQPVIVHKLEDWCNNEKGRVFTSTLKTFLISLC